MIVRPLFASLFKISVNFKLEIWTGNLFKSIITAFAVEASSPVVGSSKNKTDGEVINSAAIQALFFSPPDTPRIKSVPT